MIAKVYLDQCGSVLCVTPSLSENVLITEISVIGESLLRHDTGEQNKNKLLYN